ncbi:MAG TPA: NUDIX domain-containing protein [Candidatus Latescibacteria bacterium]|nr:NUDIX domain-containing protein [Candidatus Latescibacterota bacterium]
MSDELLDVYDENGYHVAEATRSEVHEQGLWHKTVHVWVFAPGLGDGQILFQQRSDAKDIAPGMIDVAVGGHLSKGENPLAGAVRELKEELGIRVPVSRLRPLGVRQSAHRFGQFVDREIQTLYGVVDNRGLENYSVAAQEIAAILHVPANAGLEFFSGRLNCLVVPVLYSTKPGSAATTGTRVLKTVDFLPSVDGYFARVCLAAQHLRRGDAQVLL